MIVRELAAALGVLALVFLSFAHQPVGSSTTDGLYLLSDGSVPIFCGSGPAGENGSLGGGCDACRIAAGIALPDVPCGGTERFALAAQVPGFYSDALVILRHLNRAVRPRAPPFA